MLHWLFLPLVALCSCLLCLALVRQASPRFLDQPIARSAHSTPVPRGGGAAIVAGFYLYVALLYFQGNLSVASVLVLCCAIPVAVVGFVDDLRPLPVRVRLPVHLLAGTCALLVLGPVPDPFFSGWLTLPWWLQWGLLVVALVWLINLYNFMDGIDALAAGQALFVAGVAGLMLALQRDPMAWICAALVAAILGFMVWNLPPAKLFLGDVGSTFLGFILGLIALLTHYAGSLSVWVWVLLMGGFIADTTCTLLVRSARGLSITEGHSTHAYQHLARRLNSHAAVSALLTIVNTVWLLPLAWAAHRYPDTGVIIAISGILPLMIMAALLGAGREQGMMLAVAYSKDSQGRGERTSPYNGQETE